LTDSDAFGTGHHPTTALCIEALEEILSVERLDGILDVGTGSGILALAALMLGVPHAVGRDTDGNALNIAEKNARLNNCSDRLKLILGGPNLVDGSWPLVIANLLAGPLIEMAPILVRRVARSGRLILSVLARIGIPKSIPAFRDEADRFEGARPVDSPDISSFLVTA
jgi:ribosomal protein L11 methyltransferase